MTFFKPKLASGKDNDSWYMETINTEASLLLQGEINSQRAILLNLTFKRYF